jgi:HAE1 family hydrophobic/amphiphilic exporter-1
MAVAVIGGLITSTMLTLLVVPVVYSLLDRFNRKRAVEGAESDAAPTALADAGH